MRRPQPVTCTRTTCGSSAVISLHWDGARDLGLHLSIDSEGVINYANPTQAAAPTPGLPAT